MKTDAKRALTATLAGGAMAAVLIPAGMGRWDLSAAVLLLIGLYVYGWMYNRYIQSLGADLEGFTWLAVVVGVGVTLLGIGLLDVVLDWNAAFIGLIAFAASGFEMCRGAVARYIRLRRRLRSL